MTDKQAAIVQLTEIGAARNARTIDALALRDLVKLGTHLARIAAAPPELGLDNDPDSLLALAVAGAVLLEWLEQFAPEQPSCYGTIHAAIETRQRGTDK